MKQKKCQLKTELVTDEKKLRTLLLRYLAKRDYAYQELVNIFIKRGFAESLVHEELNKLKAKGYIDDERFACNFTRYRKARGFGPQRILYDLKLRGIDDGLIAENIKISDNDWLIEMQSLMAKRFNQHSNDPNTHAKIMRFFLNRGFTRNQIFSLLKEHED